MSPRRVLAPLALVAVLIAGCSSSGNARPTTAAKLVFESPTPNEVTGSNLTIKLGLTGATVVPQTSGKLTANRGHINVTVDNKWVAMAFGTSQDVNGLTPGPHTMQAEFVAIDHRPFANRPTATVLFIVR